MVLHKHLVQQMWHRHLLNQLRGDLMSQELQMAMRSSQLILEYQRDVQHRQPYQLRP